MKMKKIILTLILFLPFIVQAQEIKVDERISDVYFANGIMNTEKDAKVTHNANYFKNNNVFLI
jgi:predicted transcriptional regulator